MEVPAMVRSAVMVLLFALVTVVSCAASVASVRGLGGQPGPGSDGTAYLPVGWRVTPAGIQKPAGFFSVNVVLSPDERAVLVPGVVRNQHDKQTIDVLDAVTGDLVQEVELDPSVKDKREGVAPGLVFSHDGKHVFVATAKKDSVLVFDWDADGRRLSWDKTLVLPDGAYPQTVAVSPDDSIVLVVGQYARRLFAVNVASGTITSAAVGQYPFAVAVSGDGETAYVSNQAGTTVSVVAVDGQNLTPRGEVRVGTHPNYLLADSVRHRLFVSNGDSDSISMIDTSRNVATRTISVAPYKEAGAGTSPTSLALSVDGRTLYVANSGNNDVAVIDVAAGQGFGQVRGLIPTGWYPTGVQVPRDGSRLLIANAKGLGTGPNTGHAANDPRDFSYIERQLQGYVQVVPMPGRDQLRRYTRQVLDNNGVAGRNGVRGFNGQTPGTIVPRRIVPPRIGWASPIRHVIYIVKENRTYDQVLGDLGKGNGDPLLAIFGRDITPNQHALAERFVTLDNYYVDGEVSQDGWDWATEANSNPYNQLATHQGYGGTGSEFDSAGWLDSPVTAGNADPSRAFVWDAAHAAGMSFRHYGMFSQPATSFGKNNQVRCPAGKNCAYEPLLDDNTDHDYPWFDLNISDQQRFEEWHREFTQYLAHGNLPTFEFLNLPRDHTAGWFGGGASAKAMVADNDLALGRIVDAVSHSKYWKDTAIFVTEDDAQDGPDHVDSHRSLALVISPYTQRGIVDSHFYSQVSLLRTMELLMGLGPLTQYDAAALPMIWSFGDTPHLAPYSAIIPRQSLTEINPPNTPSVMTPQAMQGAPDQVDQQALNREIWKCVRGSHATMPKPQHRIYGKTTHRDSRTDGDGH
jgi:YVTN family beta-propeller protein